MFGARQVIFNTCLLNETRQLILCLAPVASSQLRDAMCDVADTALALHVISLASTSR